jgi:DNA-binding beta-propeller fold protein YncE
MCREHRIATRRAAFLLVAWAAAAQAQDNPYTAVEGWAKMPAGRAWGATSAVDIDKDGKSIWVAERCAANSCVTSDLPAVLKFSESGELLTSFGAGMFAFPHGIHVDKDGNVWVTDTDPLGAKESPPGKANFVVKFSPEGKVLMTLGKPGVRGDALDLFNQPSDVVTAPNGDIFVADGHGPSGPTNNRIVKFDKNGKFLKTWGKRGTAPGEFDGPHAIAMDSKGRLFVADRGNNRLQIFDQDGKFLDEWKQWSRISGLYIDKNDILYAADSESNARRNAGWKRGIRIGSVKDGKVTAFIPDPVTDADASATSGAEGVAADAKGNVYGAEVGPRTLRKYVKK